MELFQVDFGKSIINKSLLFTLCDSPVRSVDVAHNAGLTHLDGGVVLDDKVPVALLGLQFSEPAVSLGCIGVPHDGLLLLRT